MPSRKPKRVKAEAVTWDSGVKTYHRHMQSREVSQLYVFALCGAGIMSAHEVERLRFQGFIDSAGSVTPKGVEQLRASGELSVTLMKKFHL